MLDRLIDLVIQFIDAFKFVTIVHQYERGVRMRFGICKGEVEPGLRFYWPFGVEHILTAHVVPDTWPTHPLSITTSDGKACVLAAIITHEIRDIKKALLSVENTGVVCSLTCGAIVAEAGRRTWAEVQAPEFGALILKEARKIGFRYGVEVSEIAFTDVAMIKSLRLLSAQH